MEVQTKKRGEKLAVPKAAKTTSPKESGKRKATPVAKKEELDGNLESAVSLPKKTKVGATKTKNENGTAEDVPPVAEVAETLPVKKGKTKAEAGKSSDASDEPSTSAPKRPKGRAPKAPPAEGENDAEKPEVKRSTRVRKPAVVAVVAPMVVAKPKAGKKKKAVADEPSAKSPKKAAIKKPVKSAAVKKETVPAKKPAEPKGRSKKVEVTNGDNELPPADSVVEDEAPAASPPKKSRGKKAQTEKPKNIIQKIVADVKGLTGKSRKKKKDDDEEDEAGPSKAKQKKTEKKKDDDENDEAGPSKAKPKKTEKKPLVNSSATNYSNIDLNLPDKEWNFKISSWNVAGLRAWISKGGLEFIDQENPDIICLQETKCTTDQLPEETKIKGYHPYWLCKPGGQAGVAIYSKIMPMFVTYGMKDAEQDDEGRLMTAEYEKFFLVCAYVPNAGRKLVTLPKRLDWDKKFQKYVKDLDARKPVIICGDMNVAHNEIDLANPKTNKRNAGFTQEERDGMSDLLSLGFVDTYRHLYPDTEKSYSFWTYMMNARAKNVGWRIDYFLASERLLPKVVDNVMRTQIMGSDHCPITLFLNNIIK